ncbi:hypothetical protein ACWF95_39080 [Streptomyces vinaceus]
MTGMETFLSKGGKSRCSPWRFKLTTAVKSQHYQGGKFFVYDPRDKKVSGPIFRGDVPVRTVERPEEVIFSADEVGYTEIRYGNPEEPQLARLVASSSPRPVN